MWFRRPKAAVCAVCGKAIAPAERRFVDQNRITKKERHTSPAGPASLNNNRPINKLGPPTPVSRYSKPCLSRISASPSCQ